MTHRPLLLIAGLVCSPILLFRSDAAAGPRETAWDAKNREIRSFLERGDTAAALKTAEAAAALAAESFGPDHMKTAVSFRKLADLQRLGGQRHLAAASIGKAHSAWSASLGGTHPYVLEIGIQTARDLEAAGDLPAAVRALTQVVRDQKLYYGERHSVVAGALSDLARVERAAGLAAEADRHEREAVDLWLATLPPSDSRVLRAFIGLASRLSAEGDVLGARAVLRRVLDAADAASGLRTMVLADAQILAGDLALQDHDGIAAEEFYKAAEATYDAVGDAPEVQSRRLALLYKQREFYQASGRESEALRVDEASRSLERVLNLQTPGAEE